uniref:Uncharacterized protein n=1 Tax=Panagrolaimus davidi TaxID=227884 RepID=A0A914PLC6_9BILA
MERDLTKELDSERKKNQILAKQAPPPPQQQSLEPLPQPSQHQRQYERSFSFFNSPLPQETARQERQQLPAQRQQPPQRQKQQEQQLRQGEIMKECKCEIFRHKIGDLQYKCSKDFDINVCYFEENGQLTVTLAGGFIINTFPSKQLEIHRTATNEKSIIDPSGTRYEYYNVTNEANQTVKIFDKNGSERQNPDGSTVTLEYMNTSRNKNDTVEQKDSYIKFSCPGFYVSRCLGEDFGGGVAISVKNNESTKAWKINVCPEHCVFYINHYNETQEKRCFHSDRRYDHLKN